MAQRRKKNNLQLDDAWYTEKGKNEDIVLSTRLTLCRNLANFPFPQYENEKQTERVLSIIYDVFNHLEDAEKYKLANVDDLDPLGRKILEERGIFQQDEGPKIGLVIRNDGKLSCQINSKDHIRISSYKTGLNLDCPYKAVKEMDEAMQKRLQFAGSWDFGYLTASIDEVGSGLRIYSTFFLPGLSLSDKIWPYYDTCKKNGCLISGAFGNGNRGCALGNFYILTNQNCLNGNEEEQISSFKTFAKEVIKTEKEIRKEAFVNKFSIVKDMIYRSFALVKYSLFIQVREAVEIISALKIGLSLNLLQGIDDNKLNALLYRIQDGHLEYVLKNGNFDFPSDIEENMQKKIERLRCILLQEAVENVSLT